MLQSDMFQQSLLALSRVIALKAVEHKTHKRLEDVYVVLLALVSLQVVQICAGNVAEVTQYVLPGYDGRVEGVQELPLLSSPEICLMLRNTYYMYHISMFFLLIY